MRLALALALVLAACQTAAPAPTPAPPAPAPQAASASPTPTPPTITVRRASPERRVFDGLDAIDVRAAPDGWKVAITECVTCGTIVSRTRLWIMDAGKRAPPVLFYIPPPPVRYAPLPMPQEMDGFVVHSWSPDSRYLVGWLQAWSGFPPDVEAHLHNAREVLVFDVQTARAWTLGPVLTNAAAMSWSAPHTLAYVAGGDLSTWSNKEVRLWSPDLHERIVASGASWSPTFDGAGFLYLVRPEPPTTPDALVHGRAAGVSFILALRPDGTKAGALPQPPIVWLRASGDHLLAAVAVPNGIDIRRIPMSLNEVHTLATLPDLVGPDEVEER